jgi:hopanoid biosynthesis associated radical SAM protein HpnH
MRYPLGLVYDSAKHLLARWLRPDTKCAISVTLDPLGGHSNRDKRNNSPLMENEAREAEIASMLSVAQSLAALEECPAPIVAISGGEPLEYPEIQALTREILARGKHLFLCTDGILIRRRLHMIPPYTNFFWNVRLDGTESVHDARTGRPGLCAEALDGVKAAKNAGFFVVVTTTIYPDSDITDVAQLFQRLHEMHVDGYMLSPSCQKGSLNKSERLSFQQNMQDRFREVSNLLGDYNLMISPVYLEFLRGERELDSCAWGSAVYGPRGWSGRCSSVDQEFVQSYAELQVEPREETEGQGSDAPRESCRCDVGVESAALLGLNAKAGDTWKMLAWPFGGSLGEKRERAGQR